MEKMQGIFWSSTEYQQIEAKVILGVGKETVKLPLVVETDQKR